MYRVHIPMIGVYETSDPFGDQLALENARRTKQLIADFGVFAFNRANSVAHISASAFILSRDRRKTLLMHHAKLDMWLQPGGHCEPGETVLQAAKREAIEETGLIDVALISHAIFDIDIHEIPARAKEPSHLHYDFRFLFECDTNWQLNKNSESKDLRWMTKDEVMKVAEHPSIKRIASQMAP